MGSKFLATGTASRATVVGDEGIGNGTVGIGGDGIVVRGTSNPLPPGVTVNNHIVGNIVLNNTGTGIFVSGHRNFIENNQAGEEGLGNGGSGIVVANSSTPPLPQGVTVNNTITDNNIFDNGRDGIGVSGDKNLIATNSVGDVRKGNGGNGIVVQGNLNVVNDHNTIFANGFTNGLPNGSSGIVVTGNENTLEINNIGDTNKGNGGDGIQVSGAKNLLKENKIFASAGDGIEVSGGTAGPTSGGPNVLVKNSIGDRGKGNGGHGIFIHDDVGNGTPDPVELDSNVVKSSGKNGILIATGATGHELKRNSSGGSGDVANGLCAFDVAAGNFNATGNSANGKGVSGADGSPFPTGCLKRRVT